MFLLSPPRLNHEFAAAAVARQLESGIFESMLRWLCFMLLRQTSFFVCSAVVRGL